MKGMERSELIDLVKYQVRLRDEHLRRLIIEEDRIDILATLMGYTVKPFHVTMWQWQFNHQQNLQLVFRGAGKSTTCTVVKAVHLLIKNRNLRILIGSKTSTNAEGFLKEIKAHLEDGIVPELFGKFYDPNKTSKWDNKEIEVLGKTTKTKESSITCVGVDGTIVSKHYDVMLSDDLVDEANTSTKHMRKKTETWFFKTLMPCLEPPDDEVPHRGEHHMLGTRYHDKDLYQSLMDGGLKGHVHKILPYDEQGRTVWPEKFTFEWFMKKLEDAGKIIFNSQYLNDVEAMKGEIFEYAMCVRVGQHDLPPNMDYFMGVDLAIKLKKKNDRFAIVVVGRHKNDYYVVDCFAARIRVGQQTKKIVEYWRKWKPVNIGIEDNAYQDAQRQLVEDWAEEEGIEDLVITGITTSEDKITKAWRIAPMFENEHMHFLTGPGGTPGPGDKVIDEVIAMPNGDHDDLFDGLEMAVRASRKRRRKRKNREEEVGLI